VGIAKNSPITHETLNKIKDGKPDGRRTLIGKAKDILLHDL